MTFLQLILVQANVWFLAFCVIMPYLGKTAKGIAQFTSLFAGTLLLSWSFFGFVAARELTAESALNNRYFYTGAAAVTVLSLIVVWKPWQVRE